MPNTGWHVCSCKIVLSAHLGGCLIYNVATGCRPSAYPTSVLQASRFDFEVCPGGRYAVKLKISTYASGFVDETWLIVNKPRWPLSFMTRPCSIIITALVAVTVKVEHRRWRAVHSRLGQLSGCGHIPLRNLSLVETQNVWRPALMGDCPHWQPAIVVYCAFCY